MSDNLFIIIKHVYLDYTDYCEDDQVTTVSVSLQALDYSDDEKEQQAKRKTKNSRKMRDGNSAGTDTHTHTHCMTASWSFFLFNSLPCERL